MEFSEHVKIRKEKFGTVIFDTLTEKIFITNEIGGEILQFIEQGKSFPEMLCQFKNTYKIDAGVIEKDAGDFIEHLRINKFIKKEAEVL